MYSEHVTDTQAIIKHLLIANQQSNTKTSPRKRRKRLSELKITNNTLTINSYLKNSIV